MVIRTARYRPPAAVSTADNTGAYKVFLFVGFVVLLILWSLWGKGVEQKYYGQHRAWPSQAGKIGAEILFSGTGNDISPLIVGRVYPGSPAWRAGLEPGDRIVGLDGKLITTPNQAAHIFDVSMNNTVLALTIEHDGRNVDMYILVTDHSRPDKTTKCRLLTKQQKIGVAVLFFVLTSVMFFLLYHHIGSRVLIISLFASLFVVLGLLFKVYSPIDAFFAINVNTISLLLGMGILAAILDMAGFFGVIAFKLQQAAGNSRLKIMVLFCLLTYFLSLFANNLIVMMIVVPMTMNLAANVGFDPRPVIIGEIISSNLGGASTMIGDFPNMIISSETGIAFIPFIANLMPICLILLGVLLVILKKKSHVFGSLNVLAQPDKMTEPRLTSKERSVVRRALFVLFHMIFLFCLSEWVSLSTSAVALIGGLSLFLFSGIDKKSLLSRIPFNDILFFTGLFVVVGGLEATCLLEYVSKGIVFLSFGKVWLLSLVVMWSAAFITAFLSAGPTTALLIPVELGLGMQPPHHIIWWALSLGVLAGASASIVGATAGPVSISLIENYSKKYRMTLAGGNTLTSSQFSQIGLPVMFAFLAFSTVYILWMEMFYLN
jgi:Na+/H+ antiporter NhaD/arsenite permease-like protein